MSSNDNTCHWILQRGARKGQICGKTCSKHRPRCYSHRLKLFFATEHEIYFNNIPLNYRRSRRIHECYLPRISS